MASRLNTRFLLILITVAGGLAIAVAGIAFYALRDDPTRNIRAAENALAEGDYEKAIDEYARAVAKRPSDTQILDIYEKTLLQMRPESHEIAKDLYRRWMAVLNHRTQVRASESASHLPLLRELYRNGQLTPDLGWWQQLQQISAEALTRAAAASEGYDEIQFYQLAAIANQPALLDEEALDELERDLASFIEAHPAHGPAVTTAIGFLFVRAQALALSNNTVESNAKVDAVQAIVDTAVEANPNDPHVIVAQGRLLLGRRVRGEQIEPAAFEEAARRVTEMAHGTDDSILLNQSISILPYLTAAAGVEDAIAILRGYIDRHPDSVLERYMVAQLVYQEGRPDEAEAEVEAVIDSDPLPVSFLATYRFELRHRAAQLKFFIEHDRTGGLRGEELENQLTVARAARDRVREIAGDDDDAYVKECDGWLALTEGDAAVALGKFHDVVSASPVPDVRKLWGYALALDARGSTGEAISMLTQALEQAPRHERILVELARLEMKVGLNASAVSRLKEVLDANPNHEQAKRMLVQAQVAAGDVLAEGDDVARAMAAAQQRRESGDYAGARQILSDALAANPGQPNLTIALIEVEVDGGWRDSAVERFDALILEYPDNPNLKVLRESVRGGDAVDVTRAAVEANYSEEIDIAAFMYVALRRVANENLARSQQFEREGSATAAAEAREVAERADAEAEHYLAQAISLGAQQPEFVERQFVDALERGDDGEARRLANLARELDSDLARGLTFEARIHLNAGAFEDAVASLVDANKAKPYDAWIWRTLAPAYLRVGNLVDAQVAYVEAIKLDPNDAVTIRSYAQVLADMGSLVEALVLLRDAIDRNIDEPMLVDQWLALEALHGEPARAVAERRRRYRLDPADRQNAVALAGLLSMVIPSRESIINAAGEAVYTERQWNSMNAAAHEQAIAAARTQWIAEGDAIFDGLLASGDVTLNLAAARAIHYRNTGRAIEGLQYLDQFVRTDIARQPTPEAYTTIAQFLFASGAHEDALQWLTDGLPHQDSSRREIDRAIASICLATSEYARALPHLQAALEGSEEPALRLAVVEALVHLDRLDEAVRELQPIEQSGAGGFEAQLLRANIAGARGRTLRSKGQAAEAERAFADERTLIDRAIEMRNVDPRAYVMKASVLLQQYHRTTPKRPGLLDDASIEIDRALQLSAGYSQAIHLQADILLSHDPPNTGVAMRILGEHLEREDWDDTTRKRLIDLMLANDRAADAFELARAADAMQPHQTDWAIAMGQILEAQGDFGAAADIYQGAYARNRDVSTLRMWAVASLRSDEPARLASVVSTLESNTAGFAEAPALHCAYARALAWSNRFDDARRELRAAYVTYKSYVEIRAQPAALGEWTRIAGEIFRTHATVAEFEAFMNELNGGNPTIAEAFWLAREYVAVEGAAGAGRAHELFQLALDMSIDAGHPASDHVEMLYHLGETAFLLRDYQSAVAHYERLLQLNENYAQALNNLAYIYLEYLPAPEKALPLAERAVRLAPDHPSVLDTYGVALARNGQAQRAFEILERSAQLQPAAETLLHLAEAQLVLNRAVDARTTLQQAIQMNPTPDILAKINELQGRIGE